MDTYIPGAERTTYNTDQVDQELERLRKEQEQLEQRIRLEADPQKAEQLQKKLAQVERALRQKDNDMYRRQNAATSGSIL